MPVVPLNNRLSALGELIAATNLLDGVKVILFKNAAALSIYSTLADLIEADFTGYARSSAIVWGTAYVNPNQQAQVTGGSKQFNCSGATVTNTIYGWAIIIDSTVDILVAAELLPQPVTMTGVGNAVVITPYYTLPNS